MRHNSPIYAKLSKQGFWPCLRIITILMILIVHFEWAWIGLERVLNNLAYFKNPWILLSPFSWQDQNLCWRTLAFIADRGVVVSISKSIPQKSRFHISRLGLIQGLGLINLNLSPPRPSSYSTLSIPLLLWVLLIQPTSAMYKSTN